MRACLGWAAALLLFAGREALAQSASDESLRTGQAAYGDWRTDAPGVRRRLTVDDLFAPETQTSVSNPPREIERPVGAELHVPPGFLVEEFAAGLKSPRVIRVAPNGDIFVAETEAGRVRVLRAAAGGAKPSQVAVFASGLDSPYGIGFYPPGGKPQSIYVGTTTQILRFAYRNGNMAPVDEPAAIGPSLPDGGHTTRDLLFSADGKTLYVAVGSGSNFGENLSSRTGPALEAQARNHPLGAAWGRETDRADVLAYGPAGGHRQVLATGLRNCAGMALQPGSGALWCVVNERDELGDDLPPDYVTSVKPGAFYGWPWFYIGDHEDPRLRGLRPDLLGKVTVPDVLLQPHSAPLGITFYDGDQFPAEFKGDAFVTLHGSWNRAKRTGYKVVRLTFKDGKPTGEYEDFMTGFVSDDANVWGKPVDSAVAPDGSLLVTDNVGGKIWRVTYVGQ